jgi:hypothetical protein
MMDDCGADGGMSDKGNTSFAINPKRPDLHSNPGRRGGKPMTNCLSYDMAITTPYKFALY